MIVKSWITKCSSSHRITSLWEVYMFLNHLFTVKPSMSFYNSQVLGQILNFFRL